MEKHNSTVASAQNQGTAKKLEGREALKGDKMTNCEKPPQTAIISWNKYYTA